MDIIIFIIIAALGSIIFKDKKKRPSQRDQEPMPSQRSQPMTWEDMEREYGITIEHNDSGADQTSAPVEAPRTVNTVETVETSTASAPVKSTVIVKNHVEGERQAALLPATDKVNLSQSHRSLEVTQLGAGKNYKSLQALREGMKWSIILDKPKALQHRAVR